MDKLIDLLPMLGEAAWETLYIVAASLLFGGIAGLFIGLGLYVTRAGSILENRVAFTLLNVLVNIFRPIPFIIFIAAIQPLARLALGTGIGNGALIFAISIGAAFGISRIVEQNLVTVDPGVIEAARSVGAGRARIVRTVVLPEALGPLVLGYTFAFVALVDMTAVAGVIGGGGLGNFALQYGFRQFDTVVTWTAVIAIVALVQVVQLAGSSAARRILRR